MSPILASKREILHRVQCDKGTVDFALGNVDELVSAAESQIPFDDPTGWEDWISRSIKNGALFSATIIFNGENIGLITWCFDQHKEREMLVASANVTKDVGLDFTELVTLFAVKIAKQSNCKFLRFHTVRKGLIKKALKIGYNVSEIVMRLKIPDHV